jgi:cell division protein FtsQ
MLSRRRTNRRSSDRTIAERVWQLNWKRAILVTMSLSVLAAAALVFRWLLNEPISSLTVAGQLQRVSAEEVAALARHQVAGRGLVSVPVDELRRAIRRLPWVDDVAIERLWPRSLRLHVTEQVAVARWNGAELVNRRGELFGSGALQVPPELPALAGPEGRVDEVFARYVAAQARLAAAGVRLKAVSMDARGAWELGLDDGIVVRLGRSDVDARFERLVEAAWPAVGARAADISYIDMRYTNGFAISWKRGAARLASAAATPSSTTTGAGKPDA